MLRTRLLVPRVPPGCVARDRLIDRVVSGLAGRAVSVVGGAGYGKTTLVVQALERAGLPAVWCSCDARLAAASSMLGHVSAAIEQRVPGFGAGLAIDGPPDLAALELCNEVLALVPDDLVIALDDVHVLAGTPAADALAILVDDLPPNIRIVLIGRERPPVPLGRLRLQGLVEIGQAELSFTETEAHELLDARVGAAAVARLQARAEGWVTGLLLGARYGEEIADAPAGGPVFDYLAEEVFNRQSPELRDAVLNAAVLERFTVPLVAAMSPGVSPDALESALAGGLFVVPLADQGGWHRFHHLLQAFLVGRMDLLPPEERAERHRRAAVLVGASDPGEAVRHLLTAGDHAAALDRIEELAEPMLASPEADTLAAWLDEIPRELWSTRPALVLAAASLHFNRAEFDEAFASLEEAVDALLPIGEHERAALALIRLLQALGAAGGGQQERGIEAARRYLARLDPSARMVPAARMMLAGMYGYACRYAEAEAELVAVEASPVASALPILRVYTAVTRAFFVDRPQGRDEEAARALGEAIEQLEALKAQDLLAYSPYAHAYRCVMLAEAGEYAEALAQSVRMMDAAEAAGIGRPARVFLAWLRPSALAGLGRWDELAAELESSTMTFARFAGGGRAYQRHVALARLAAHRGDVARVRVEIEAARPGIVAQGYAFELAVRFCDLAAAARGVGLRDTARDLAAAAREAAERAGAPRAAARASLAAAAASDGEERDTHLAEALDLSTRFVATGLWARRERELAASLLPRAIAESLGPDGLAVRLAAECGGEVLAACLASAESFPAPSRAALVAAAGESEGIESGAVAAFLDDPADEVRDAAARASDALRARPRPALRVVTFGGFAVLRGEHPIPEGAFGRQKARALFAALLCRRGAVHREQLLDWLWPDLSPDRGVRALQTTVYDLRKALEPDAPKGSPSVIVSEGDAYRLALGEADGWDLLDIEGTLRLADGASAPEDRRDLLVRAEEISAGSFLPEWAYAPWTEDGRRDAEELRARVLSSLAETLADLGQVDAAAARLRALLALEPEREQWHRALMRLHARSGDRAMALRQYQRCRVVLRNELGIEPGAETHDLYLELLRQG